MKLVLLQLNYVENEEKHIFESGNLLLGIKIWGAYVTVILKTKFVNIEKMIIAGTQMCDGK